jgi:hypothetical protein
MGLSENNWDASPPMAMGEKVAQTSSLPEFQNKQAGSLRYFGIYITAIT